MGVLTVVSLLFVFVSSLAFVNAEATVQKCLSNPEKGLWCVKCCGGGFVPEEWWFVLWKSKLRVCWWVVCEYFCNFLVLSHIL